MISNLILLSSIYLPPISYFQALSKAQNIYIDAHEHYLKQSFRNRGQIITSHGVLTLSVPVIQTDGNHTVMERISIANQTPWQRSHWRAIEAAYNNSPFFLYYKDELSTFYLKPYDNLMQFNEDLLRFFIKKLHLNISIEKTTEFIPYGTTLFAGETLLDLRSQIHPKKESIYSVPAYIQSFEADIPAEYRGNVSVLDVLCSLGGEARGIL